MQNDGDVILPYLRFGKSYCGMGLVFVTKMSEGYTSSRLCKREQD